MLVSGSTHRARVTDYGVTATKAGDPMAFVKFEIHEGDHTEVVKWTGTFVNDMAREITLKCLGTCGLTSDRIVNLAMGPAGKALDMDKEVEIKLKADEWQGRVTIKVDRIDPIGGFAELMNKQDFSVFVGKFNLQGEFHVVAQKYGIKPSASSTSGLGDIPF